MARSALFVLSIFLCTTTLKGVITDRNCGPNAFWEKNLLRCEPCGPICNPKTRRSCIQHCPEFEGQASVAQSGDFEIGTVIGLVVGLFVAILIIVLLVFILIKFVRGANTFLCFKIPTRKRSTRPIEATGREENDSLVTNNYNNLAPMINNNNVPVTNTENCPLENNNERNTRVANDDSVANNDT